MASLTLSPTPVKLQAKKTVRREKEIPVEQKEGAFSNFPISEETVKLLKACGVNFLFPIQAKKFHHVYSGKDLIAQARTGTGKTFSFAIPLVEKLHGGLQDKKRGRAPQVLVLAPTRELANQVSKDFSDITKKTISGLFLWWNALRWSN
ncbi:nucleolar RNA helicase 2 [Sigmodon hispidus]